MKVLHFTNTDLRFDNRIIKELNAVSRIENSKVKAIGVFNIEFSNDQTLDLDLHIENINLLTSYLSFLPRALTLFFKLIEISIRFFFKGIIFRPKIIHCHDTMVLPIGVILSLLFNSKLIYDAHELESEKNEQPKLFSKVMAISCVYFSEVDSMVGNQPEFASVSPCVQNSLGLFFIFPCGLIK